MKDDYEVLETFTKNKETYSYLRHKKTGLEIAYHQCETAETGFSFCLKTPVDDPYLGTTHVLEHCVLQGSKKYDLSLLKLIDFSVYSDFSAVTGCYRTIFYFYSPIETEVFKMIPIFADYVFFPSLSEEAFMQECMRVEFSPEGDGRKKEICGVVYNEMKSGKPEDSFAGGIYYKLNELTVRKIRDYHKKYYRPDNCLIAFTGKTELEDVLFQLDKIVSELESNFSASQTSTRKNLTIDETLKEFPLKNASEKLKNPEQSDWLIDPEDNICMQISDYWSLNFSPFTPFILDKKYSYTINTEVKEYDKVPLPPKKSVQKIISEYLSGFSPEEYKFKLENLEKWQSRSEQEKARKLMEPLAVEEYDIDFPETEEELQALFKRYQKAVEREYSHHPAVEIKTEKNSLHILIQCSEPLSREYYAEYALIFCLRQFLHYRLRKAGVLYDVQCTFEHYTRFSISTISSDKPEKTLQIIKSLVKETAEYDFTESDLIANKFIFYNLILYKKVSRFYLSNKIFAVTSEDLHKAAISFSKLLEKARISKPYRTASDKQITEFINKFNNTHSLR